MPDLFASSPEKIQSLVEAINPANAIRGWQAVFKELGYPVQDEQPIPKVVLDDILKGMTDDLADHPTQKGQKEAYFLADIHPSSAQIFQILYFKLRGRITQAVQRRFIERYAKTFGRFLFVLTNDDQEFSLCVGRTDRGKDHPGTGGKETRKPIIRFFHIGPKNLYRTGIEVLASLTMPAGAAPRMIAELLWQALNVEKVTKEFYELIEQHHSALKQELDKFKRIKGFEEERSRVQFATRLLGRMVFLRFISKKGIIPPAAFTVPVGVKSNYYREILAPLFFDVLNTPTAERKNGLPPEFAKVPFLNGGLFEPHDQDGWPNPLYQLPNGWFTGLFETFRHFNFTVAENTPFDQEVAVDPEMLGKIFENLLAAENAETGLTARKEKGAFYTPREIVDYLCREALRARLQSLYPKLGKEHLAWLLDDAEKPSSQTVPSTEIIASLDKLKIIDPAVGSGAFPIGMVHVLTGVYQKLDDRYDPYKVKERIIQNNLYGADIEPIAIELAKLRCWLSLIVESDSRKEIKPLPNLDLKFFCVNSLLDPPPVDQADLFLQDQIRSLRKLEEKFFEEHSSKKKVALRHEIGKALDGIYASVRSQYVKQAIKTDRTDKKAAKKIKGAISQANQYPDDPELFAKWLESGSFPLPFFPKELLCPDVFGEGAANGTLLGNFSLVNDTKGQTEIPSNGKKSRGGFDIVVANPPYVRQEEIKEQKPQLEAKYSCYTGMADLYVYFYERGLELLRTDGALAYISSNKYFRAGYGEKLRALLGQKCTLHQVIDFGDAPVFTAIAYPSIAILTKQAPSEAQEPKVLTWEPGPPVEEFASIFAEKSFIIRQKVLTPDGWRLESPSVLRLLEKLRKTGKPLGEYVNGRFYRGILTGFNEAFVVDRATRDTLVKEHKSSAEILKPFLRGRDVKRWSIEFADQYLIKIESSENVPHPWSGKSGMEAEKVFTKTYPAVCERFQTFRDKLIEREDQGKFFWELRSCTYWQEFEQPKIVWGNLATQPQFAMDGKGSFICAPATMAMTNSDFILSVLNSRICHYLIFCSAAERQGGFVEFKPMYVSPIPIPSVTNDDRILIEKAANSILSAKRKDPSADVSAWEYEIDDHVYGLTKDEIKIVESASAKATADKDDAK